MFEKNNPKIALIILYIKEKEICPAYISKFNSCSEKQIILLTFSRPKKKLVCKILYKDFIYFSSVLTTAEKPI